jgi:hypothetical protein
VWCPYCNLELQALQEALPKFREFGANVVAISADRIEQPQVGAYECEYSLDPSPSDRLLSRQRRDKTRNENICEHSGFKQRLRRIRQPTPKRQDVLAVSLSSLPNS